MLVWGIAELLGGSIKLLRLMRRLFFYGVTMSFTCQKCRKKSTEKAVVSHTSSKQQEINGKIEERLWFCQQCGFPLVQGTQVSINVEFGTPPDLKAKGYPVSPEDVALPPAT